MMDPSEGRHRSEHTAPPPSSHFTPPSSSASLSRPGRYDPVRATFVTRSTPTLPRVISPAHQSDQDHEEEIHDDKKPPSPRENR